MSEDPNVSVLVIEKGQVKDNFVSRMPLLSQNIFLGGPLQVQSTLVRKRKKSEMKLSFLSSISM